MSVPYDPAPAPSPENNDPASLEQAEHADEEMPVSEVARRLSLLGKLIIPRAPH